MFTLLPFIAMTLNVKNIVYLYFHVETELLTDK